MINRNLTILFAFVVFASLNLSAGFLKGNELVDLMREYEKIERGRAGGNKYAEGIYLGYIMGIIDADNQKSITLSPGMKVRQLLAVVSKYLNENPEKWDKPGKDIVMDALISAFPQKEQNE